MLRVGGAEKVETASLVIEKFGGQSALARLIGKNPSTVQHWAKTGQIPAKWYGEILRLARERGINLLPGELVEPPNVGVEVEPYPASDVLPIARWSGELTVGHVPCYVLDDGRRVISRTGATDVLTGRKGGGNLESYLQVESLAPYIPADLSDQMIEFTIPEVVNKSVRGISAETFADICTAYVQAHGEGALKTQRQQEIALKAGVFLAACSKVGLIALIDEATGYQYERITDELQLKLQLYIEEEIRQWEKTFPDELWREFGRLTQWKGPITSRPKYWGKLVMELVYDYLDKDVADWLKANKPKPRHGQNYHQWLTGQYGLKKLMEHIWMLIGMASACQSMHELRRKMAEKYGRQPIQLTLFVEPPYRQLQPSRT